MEGLNSREIAIVAWVGIAFAAVLIFPKFRGSASALATVARAFFARPILASLAAMLVYLALLIWFLQSVGLWNVDQTKNTIIWMLAVGVTSLFGINSILSDPAYFSKAARDNFKVTVVVEFVASAFTLPLLVELALVPFLFFVGLVAAFTEKKPEQAIVWNLATGLLALVGAAFVLYSSYEIVAEFQEFATWRTLEDFWTPILLSLAYLPFLYGFGLFATYQDAFRSVDLGIQDRKARRYAKLMSMLHFGTNRDLLKRFARNAVIQRPLDKGGVSSLIEELEGTVRLETNPPSVDPRHGWSPYKALKFLLAEGIMQGDYHRLYDDEWQGNSPYFKVGSRALASNIAYYVTGNGRVARELVLELNVNNVGDAGEGDKRFLLIAQSLLRNAVGVDVGNSLQLSSVAGDVQFDIGETKISLSRKDWQDASYSRELSLKRSDANGP